MTPNNVIENRIKSVVENTITNFFTKTATAVVFTPSFQQATAQDAPATNNVGGTSFEEYMSTRNPAGNSSYKSNGGGPSSSLSPLPGSSSCITNTVDSHITNTVAAAAADQLSPLLIYQPLVSLDDASVRSTNLPPSQKYSSAQRSPQ